MQLANAPETVFICNTSLHIMNAMDACKHWDIAFERAWLVIKTVPAATPESIYPVLALAKWGKVIWISDFPVEGRGVLSFWRFQLEQVRFHRLWQSELLQAKYVARVFVSLNRMKANRIVANWLCPRELVWLDDGTLTYALALDSVLPKVKVRTTFRKISGDKKSTPAVVSKVNVVNKKAVSMTNSKSVSPKRKKANLVARERRV